MTPKLTGKTSDAKRTKTEKTKRSHEERAHVLEVSGLCVSCATAETCEYRKTSRGPVHFCEEFDDSRDLCQTMYRKVVTPLTPCEGPAEPEVFKGLCVNCEHRMSCDHAHTEGGVWHCENYE